MNKYSKLFKLVRMELRYTQKDLANRLKVDPGSIYKYENEKMTPGIKVLDKMYKLCEEESLNESIKLINNFDVVNKETNDMDARYLIELQRDKISYQEEKISILQKQIDSKEAESIHWDVLEYDFYVESTLNFTKGFSRVVTEVTNIEEQSKKLGYTPSEIRSFWDIGVSHRHTEDMPLKKLLDESTLAMMRDRIKTFPAIFRTLKNIVGHHYIPMPVIYLHKDGSKVPGISYNKVKWSEMVVYSKVEYIKV